MFCRCHRGILMAKVSGTCRQDSIPGASNGHRSTRQQAGIALDPRRPRPQLPQLPQLHRPASIHPSLEGIFSLTTTRNPTATTCPLSLTACHTRWRVSCHNSGVGISERSRRDAPGPSCHWRDESMDSRRLLLHTGILPLPPRHPRRSPQTRHDQQRNG